MLDVGREIDFLASQVSASAACKYGCCEEDEWFLTKLKELLFHYRSVPAAVASPHGIEG